MSQLRELQPHVVELDTAERASPQVAITTLALWKWVGVFSLCLLLLTTSILAFYSAYEIGQLRHQMEVQARITNERWQQLDATIGFETKRNRMLLGIRDEILTANPRLNLNDGYRYAEWILKACEKYPALDPRMLLAIGIVESAYDRGAISRANAQGLYQIEPTTGRMLARALDWTFTDEILFDPQKNTEMAALYLDILFAAYNDARLVLAEYNGGPLNAGYLRAGETRAAAETRDYVVKVMDVYERLQNDPDLQLASERAPIYIDAKRDGKSLPPLPRGRPETAALGAGQP